MIPKIIHYCWFGHNPKSPLAEKCIKSWKKYCPDYEIVEWNEDNFNIGTCSIFAKQAYERKQWAFVSDYVRLKVIYENGGIYLDTDVELRKNLDEFLEYNAYFGFENGKNIATGLGFGAVRNAPIIRDMIAMYDNNSFILPDGSYNNVPCPQRDTTVFLQHGLVQDNSRQILPDSILILPKEYLCPIDYELGLKKITNKTVSIHWFSASWQSDQQKRKHKKLVRIRWKSIIVDYIIHIPNKILKRMMGENNYDIIKEKLGRG